MKKFICLIQGHDLIAVCEAGIQARPGGILPSVDGRVAYKPCSNGEHSACMRCGKVLVDEGEVQS